MPPYIRRAPVFALVVVALTTACLYSSDSSESIADVGKMTVLPSSLPADGISQAQVIVALGQADGLPTANVPITLSCDLPGVTLVQPARTDAAGRTVGTLTGTTPGQGTLRATAHVNGQQLALRAQAAVTLTQPGNVSLTLTPHAGNAVANGTDQLLLPATAQDDQGQPLVGEQVRFTSDQSVDLLVPTLGTTDALGTATVALSSTRAGPHRVSATVRQTVAQTLVALAPEPFGSTSQLLLSITDLEGISSFMNPCGLILGRVHAAICGCCAESDD